MRYVEVLFPVAFWGSVVVLLAYLGGSCVQASRRDQSESLRALLEKCADVPGRDYEGCMDRERDRRWLGEVR